MNTRLLIAIIAVLALITGCSPSIVGLTSGHPELKRQAEALDASLGGSDDSLRAFFAQWAQSPIVTSSTAPITYQTEAAQIVNEFFQPTHSSITPVYEASSTSKPYTTIG